jgi:hypothetical protein
MEAGVPRENIIVQDRSMNTKESVTFSIPLLSDRLDKINKVILIARPSHMRRARATFLQHFPKDVEVICQPAKEHPHPSELEEDELMDVAIRCLEEYFRIDEYGKKGDIVKQKFPFEVSKAAVDLIYLIDPFLSEKQKQRIGLPV